MIEAYLAGDVPTAVLNDWLEDQGQGPVGQPQQRLRLHGPSISNSRGGISRTASVSGSNRSPFRLPHTQTVSTSRCLHRVNRFRPHRKCYSCGRSAAALFRIARSRL